MPAQISVFSTANLFYLFRRPVFWYGGGSAMVMAAVQLF